ncbi:MAG: alpha-ketoglutarate-dependent dioxygenase AlkB [Deltaproteobacteria bacterium]|nr:alpha-ketoglutarate-dependent dioxygenase AlkB [Deltaproteobacteria bacterium]
MAVASPEGFIYRPDFLSNEEEEELVREIRTIEFADVKMRGQVARRRVTHFGWLYNYDSWKIEPGPLLPQFLIPLKERGAALAQIEADQLAEALITEYPPGAGIGWHRDAPAFGIVVGVSLRSACPFRLRKGAGASEYTQVMIEPRSAYILRDEARSKWQHSIPPTKALRYSITFRALRSGKAG